MKIVPWLALLASMTGGGAAAGMDLGDYLTRPPIEGPLMQRSELLSNYGAGCVRRVEEVPGEIHDEIHDYYDPASGHWVEAIVEVGGPSSEEVTGVLVSDVPLCAEKMPLSRPVKVKSLFGIKLGAFLARLVARMGEPIRMEAANLGSATDLKVFVFSHGGPDSGLVLNYYVRQSVVVAFSVEFSE